MAINDNYHKKLRSSVTCLTGYYEFILLKYVATYAHINIMLHYPFLGDGGEEVGIWIMQNSNASLIGHARQSNPYCLPT